MQPPGIHLDKLRRLLTERYTPGIWQGQADVRPAPIPMFLALRSVQEALGPKGD